MKKVLFLLIFFISFFFSFILTFPAKTAIEYVLNTYNIQYLNIKGNFFAIRISGLKIKDFILDKLVIENKFPLIVLKVDEKNYLRINALLRKGHLHLKNLILDKFQQNNKYLLGDISGNFEVFYVDNFLVLNGNGIVNIARVNFFKFKNLSISFNLKKQNKISYVKAEILGRNIKGNFEGKLEIPIKNIRKTKLEGFFRGSILGNNITQKISFSFLSFKGF